MSFTGYTCLAQEQHPDLLYSRLQVSQRTLRSEIGLDLHLTRITVYEYTASYIRRRFALLADLQDGQIQFFEDASS